MKISIPVVLCLCLLLSGCWDRNELNSLALIRGVGIDRLEDGKVQVTVEISVPKALNSQNGSGSSGNGGTSQSNVRSGKGNTISDALEDLQGQIPRKIFWGHTEVILINDEMAANGIQNLTDYFVRNPQTRMHAYVYITKGSTRDLLGIQTRLYSPSEVLLSLSESGLLLQTTLLDLLDQWKTGELALPVVEKSPLPADHSQSNPYISSSAVFKGDKMIGIINAPLTRGVKWIQNDIKETQVSVYSKKGGGYVSMSLRHAEVKLDPVISDGKWTMNIQARTQDDIVSNETPLNFQNPQNILYLEKLLEKQVKKRILQTLSKLQNEYKSDIVGFGDVFYRKYPKEWNQNKDQWDKIFPTVDVHVRVKADVLRPGTGNAHYGVSR